MNPLCIRMCVVGHIFPIMQSFKRFLPTNVVLAKISDRTIISLTSCGCLHACNGELQYKCFAECMMQISILTLMTNLTDGTNFASISV